MIKKISFLVMLFIMYNLIMAEDMYAVSVSNWSELQSAINSKQTDIVTTTSIKCESTLYINYSVTIRPGTSENALQRGFTGHLIVVQNGGTLNLSSIVVDMKANSSTGYSGVYVQSGGTLIFNGSLVDIGSNNAGINVTSGGKCQITSGTLVNGSWGIRVRGTGNLSFTGSTEIYNNYHGIHFIEFSGTCNLNNSYIKVRNNTNGIFFESGTGTLNVSAGSYYSNSNCGIVSYTGTTNISGNSLIYSNTSYGVVFGSSANISGGSIYNNGKGVVSRGNTLKITGGTIYNNTYGVYLESGYTGSFNMTGGTIKNNTTYDIYHGQSGDGTCTILGGTISGVIYLALEDNYINTNSSYPTFTVTPKTYALGRKLVKTDSNTAANTELSKVTMTASGSWYKYVQDEYIVVWSGGNVIVKHVDQDGNVLGSELVNGSIGTAYTTSAKEFEGYTLVTTPSNATGTYTSSDITVIYEYAFIKGTITVTNVDNTDNTKALAGSIFKLELLDDNGNIDSSFTAIEKTAGDDGVVTFEEILPGKYIITQTKAMDGYNLNKNSIEIETTIDNIDADITVKNIVKVALPETGSTNYAAFISILGASIMFGIIIIRICKKKTIKYIKE